MAIIDDNYIINPKTEIFAMLKCLLDLGQWSHLDVPACQMLWILTLACLQFTDDYWIRHIHPDYTLEFAQLVDAGVQQLFQMCGGADTGSWLEHTQECICLPIRLQGCSLRKNQRIGTTLSLWGE
jgi:hypothetical protein